MDNKRKTEKNHFSKKHKSALSSSRRKQYFINTKSLIYWRSISPAHVRTNSSSCGFEVFHQYPRLHRSGVFSGTLFSRSTWRKMLCFVTANLMETEFRALARCLLLDHQFYCQSDQVQLVSTEENEWEKDCFPFKFNLRTLNHIITSRFHNAFWIRDWK